MFELTHEYPRFSNFFQKIVKPAIKEINDFTDLKILDVLKIKEDRNVVALQFHFTRKNAEEIEIAHSLESRKMAINLFTTLDEGEEVDFVEAEEILVSYKGNEAEAVNDKDRLFLVYQQNVVANFGVTPTVFLNALDGKRESEVQKAIRVTEHAQKEGNVKNLAGFFIEALRQNFTNEKEEKTKKKIEKQGRVEEIQAEIQQLSEERELLINDKIRSLTALQPSLTEDMIDRIEQNPYLRIFLDGKKAKIGRALNIEDYRQDVELRTLVKQGFFDEFKSDFLVLTKKIDEKIAGLEKLLSSIQLG
jgi:hypothetical protein